MQKMIKQNELLRSEILRDIIWQSSFIPTNTSIKVS